MKDTKRRKKDDDTQLTAGLVRIAETTRALAQEASALIVAGTEVHPITSAGLRDLALMTAQLADLCVWKISECRRIALVHAITVWKRRPGRPKGRTNVVSASKGTSGPALKNAGRKSDFSLEQKRELLLEIEEVKRSHGVTTDKAAIECLWADVLKERGQLLRADKTRKEVKRLLPKLSRIRTELDRNLRPRKLHKSPRK